MVVSFSPMETIAAISTPRGIGGIAVIRISGDRAIEIADRIFTGKKSLHEVESHRVVYGKVVDPETGETIDDVLVTVMRAPHTYTGEDIVEISSHGGLIIPGLILEILLKNGARLAQPGEFTERAFLNGRLDLVQAVGVKEVIEATSRRALKIARRRLDGELSSKFDTLKNQLLDLLKEVEARVDFEEDVPPLDEKLLEENVHKVMSTIDDLVERGEKVQKLFDGIRVVIAGRPNVGKSTLFNKILNEERAIVTDIPGTTRDVISEQILLNGFPVRLMDTAGLRETSEKVELIGINLAKESLQKADLVIFVIDGSEELEGEDIAFFKKIQVPIKILVVNKIDRGLKVDLEELKTATGNPYVCPVSSLTGEGVDRLVDRITELLEENFSVSGEMNITEREKGLLLSARSDLAEALRVKKEGYPLDIVSFHIREAIFRLDEILGIGDIPERVLDRIFEEFCIGK